MDTELWRKDGETLDDLGPGLRILQGRAGYRFSLDPVLLCGFARIRPQDRVLDLGTGAGIIPLLLASRHESIRVVGVERQEELADRARRSAQLNRLDQRVEIVCGDMRAPEVLSQYAPFTAVLSNPPYRPAGTGRLSPGSERAAARHELAGGLEDFVGTAARCLDDGGRFFVIHLAERLTDILCALRLERLEPKRLRIVQSRAGEAARLVLVEGRKGAKPGLLVEDPLVIYAGDGYSREVLAMYETKTSVPPQG
ncbi:tRNA1(Val) (adenine(37)-N6)-methyltransferase [Desulfuromonas sp. KJ2020]|uniref:tRNA1(Val) (adenine(37)-N6)-methyltransferase n=1 Tax=Desulfuromonas sp. KJ2020 TaxID=2919173 RepID=UPI0020A6F225|nr:tRNA1(Val) (adenine(37)-N6)-methyltransferase [Desulfuromonas sp. KJ2020]MCP3175531.1 tRNA1(Val) (adenine(37)-N6)-methyltransferase [Desulfuromonas sp. KJ2020]